MTLREIMKISPLGCVGMFFLGGVFAAQFGMGAVYGAKAGLTVPQISIFVGAFYVGALVLQYPIGWMSDRMDRRLLILGVALLGGAASVLGMLLGGVFWLLLVAALIIGGTTNPLYSLLIAHTNDFLNHEDMAAASGGLIFINGLGAIAGPVVTGWLMGDEFFGAAGFFVVLVFLLFALSAYAAYRTTQRPSVPVDETGTMASIMPAATSVAVEYAQEYAAEADQEAEDAA